jgi:HD-like signal output (HDOD) protein
VDLPVLGFLALVGAFFIALLFSLKGKKRPERGSSVKRKAASRPVATQKPEHSSPASAELAEKAQAVATPSPLHTLDYSVVPDGVCPTPLQDVDEETRRSVEKSIATLPPMPTASYKLYDLLKNPFSNAKDISSLVSTNPVLSGKILRTINSAYFGLSQKITSVGRAIVLLGYNNIKALVMQDTLRNSLPGKQLGEDTEFNELWIHSTAVSACAHYLSQNVFRYTGSDMATIGLFHDIGKYFFKLLENGSEPPKEMPSIIQEEKQYGVNHALRGSLLVHNWNLAAGVIKSVELHHNPVFLPPESVPEPFLKPALIVCLSDLICKALGHGHGDDQLFPIKTEYFEKIKMTGDIETMITPGLVREIEKARHIVESYIHG